MSAASHIVLRPHKSLLYRLPKVSPSLLQPFKEEGDLKALGSLHSEEGNLKAVLMTFESPSIPRTLCISSPLRRKHVNVCSPPAIGLEY